MDTFLFIFSRSSQLQLWLFVVFFNFFFHKSHLRCSGDEPNAVEDRIRKEAFKHVSLTVNFASVDFIEQRHENERIENNGKMLRWL